MARPVYAALFALACLCAEPAVAYAQNSASKYSSGLHAYDQGDYETAMSNWETASENGNGLASYRLGLMFGSGIGVNADAARATELMDLAAIRGIVGAHAKFKEYFELAYGAKNQMAFRLAKALHRTESGDPMALHYIATIFSTGIGVKRNLVLAGRWYQRAAVQGHAPSQRALISIYAMGLGRKRDHIEAYKWYIIYQAHAKTGPDKKLEFLIGHVTKRMAPAYSQQAKDRASSWLSRHANR